MREGGLGLAFFLGSMAILILILFVPILILLDISAQHGLFSAFQGPFLSSVALTLAGATVASLVAVLLGTPTAYALARGLVGGGKLAATLEAIIASPLTIPHIIAGIAILLTFSPISPIYPLLGGVGVLQSFLGLVLAYIFVSSPIYVSSMKESISRFDNRIELAARTLGASSPRVFAQIVVPNMKGSMLESFLVTWARSVSEFGSILILAYFVVAPPVFKYVQPASVYVYSAFETGGLFSSVKYAGALLLISMLLLVALEVVKRRPWKSSSNP